MFARIRPGLVVLRRLLQFRQFMILSYSNEHRSSCRGAIRRILDGAYQTIELDVRMKNPFNHDHPPADTPLVNVQVDGVWMQFPKGLNAVEVARRAGKFIPHYCYHPKLSIVGQLPHVPDRDRRPEDGRLARAGARRQTASRRSTGCRAPPSAAPPTSAKAWPSAPTRRWSTNAARA